MAQNYELNNHTPFLIILNDISMNHFTKILKNQSHVSWPLFTSTNSVNYQNQMRLQRINRFMVLLHNMSKALCNNVSTLSL